MNLHQARALPPDVRKGALLALLASHGFSRGEAVDLLGDGLRALSETIPQLVWRSRDLGRWTWASRQWTAFTGQSSPDSKGLGWLAHVHPDDRDATMEAWAAALDRGELDVLHRLVDQTGEGHRWFETRARPLTDEDGNREWFGTCTDVHDLQVSLQRERVLFAELQHRVRNMLASLRVMVRRSRSTPGSKETFADHLEGRLGAMARVQSLASGDPFGRVPLDQLVSGELHAVLTQEGRGIIMRGSDVTLSLPAAHTFALALHELAVNSVKFGALEREDPVLSVRWRCIEGTEGRDLVVTWSEEAPNTKAPRAHGFGLNVLERQLPYELGAKVSLEFRPQGLLCTMTFPLDALREGKEPAFEMAA